MADIQGSYDDLFDAVPRALAGMLDAGDAGASVAVFVDGEPVVDVRGGFADADRTTPWQRNAITNIWSVTKTMTALCALIVSLVVIDPEVRMAVAYVTDQMRDPADDTRGMELVTAAYDGLKALRD